MFESVLKEMEEYAAREHVPIINEGGRRALIRVIEAAAPERVLEIGTAIGYSALLFLAHGAKDASVVTLELDEERAKLARAYWEKAGVTSRVEQRLGDAGNILENLEPPAGGFDFVFIDAAKGQYPDYLKKVLPLLAPRVVIAADNVLFRGYVTSEEKPPRRYKTIVKRLREFIRMAEALEAEGFKTKLMARGDGLLLIYRGMDLEGVE